MSYQRKLTDNKKNRFKKDRINQKRILTQEEEYELGFRRKRKFDDLKFEEEDLFEEEEEEI